MVLNIAHAGARSLAPENTLAAARKALEVGADLWETDVAVTSDGELILFHDDSLARTTNAPVRFPDRSPWTFTTFTLAEIRSLDAGSWFVETDPFGQIAAGRSDHSRTDGLPRRKGSDAAGIAFLHSEGELARQLGAKATPPPNGAFSGGRASPGANR